MITLSSTSALNLIFNSILASKFLGEVFTKYDLFSIILIAFGSGLCVTFSSLEAAEPTYDVRKIFDK